MKGDGRHDSFQKGPTKLEGVIAGSTNGEMPYCGLDGRYLDGKVGMLAGVNKPGSARVSGCSYDTGRKRKGNRVEGEGAMGTGTGGMIGTGIGSGSGCGS